MDCRSQQNYPSWQTRAPSVRFHPLARPIRESTTFWDELMRTCISSVEARKCPSGFLFLTSQPRKSAAGRLLSPDRIRLITLERIMSDRLNRKQFTRLTVMALSLMLIIIGVVFMGLHYFSHW